jgi:spoIIIJ-associated protein
MADTPHEFTGKTVDEAVAEALAKLNVSRSDVAVEVLSKGSRGIFGIGSEPARVRVTLEPVRQTAQTDEESEKVEPEATTPAGVEGRESEAVSTTSADEAEAGTDEEGVATSVSDTVVAEAETSDSGADDIDLTDDELAAMASEMLSEVVRLMGFNAEVVTSWREDTDDDGSRYLLLDIEGQDLGALIGRRGETLASLQYLVRLMVNQRIKRWRNIVVDVENYKERREAQLTQLALRMADQVTDSGRAMALEPMPPNERRLVHIALRDHPTVYTQSSGEDERRKVNIVPKDTVGA